MRIKYILFFMLLSFVTITRATAEEAGFYAGIAGGVTVTQNATVSNGVIAAKAYVDPAFNFSALAGMKLTPHIRAEAEIGCRKADTFLAGSASRSLKTCTALLNGYYDFLPRKSVSPYVGIGIGAAKHRGKVAMAEDGDTSLAWQTGAGLLLRAGENIDIQAGYRYLATSDIHIFGNTVEYGAHELRLGVLYSF